VVLQYEISPTRGNVKKVDVGKDGLFDRFATFCCMTRHGCSPGLFLSLTDGLRGL
jgi:hypothetical protein